MERIDATIDAMIPTISMMSAFLKLSSSFDAPMIPKRFRKNDTNARTRATSIVTSEMMSAVLIVVASDLTALPMTNMMITAAMLMIAATIVKISAA